MGGTIKKYSLLIAANFLLMAAIDVYYRPSEDYSGNLAYRFTFVCPLRWESVAAGMAAADEALGCDTKLVGFENLNESLQAEEIRKAVYANVDGIITSGYDTEGEIADAVADARDEGIPVVLVESDLPESGRNCYIGMDHEAAGETAGASLVKATDGRARIGILVSDLSDINQAERVKGFCSATEAYEEMEIVETLACESDRMKIRKLVGQMLEETPGLDAIYCTDEIASAMLGSILEDAGYKPGEIRVVCFGMEESVYEYLREGWYSASILLDRCETGRQAVAWLRDYLNGRTGEEDVILMDTETAGPDFDFSSWEASVETDGEVWNLQ